MVHVSLESSEATDARLRHVIKSADFDILEGTYSFEEFSQSDFSSAFCDTALALVRDGQQWSQLIRKDDASSLDEVFAVWRFHFPEAGDNSGFVSWLANHLKSKFGTGVWVICGYNSSKGGVFDYWGCPEVLSEQVFSEIEALHGTQANRVRLG